MTSTVMSRWVGALGGVVAVALWTGAASGLTATPTRTPMRTPTPAPSGGACVGDCDTSGGVDVSEVIRCVGMAVGGTASPCLRCDANSDGEVTVNEVVAAVNALLNGCPLDGYEPDNELAAAQRIGCGDRQIHDLSVPGDMDWVVFDLPANMGGVIDTESVGAGFWDTTLVLYSASGSPLAYDDDGGGGGFSRIEFGCPAEGRATTYFAQAAQLGGYGLGPYGIRLTCRVCPTSTPTSSPTPTTAPDAFEPDNELADASPIECGRVQPHTAPYGDVDWVALTLDTRSTVHVRLDVRRAYVNGPSFYDAEGFPLANSYYDGQFECGRNALGPGRYNIRVDSYYEFAEYDIGILCEPCDRDDPTATATFTPTPTATPVPSDEYETDGRESAVPISCGEGLIRSLAPRGDSDWLMLQVPARSAVRIATLSGFATPQLALQDASGRDIGFGYGAVDRVCGESALEGGTYFVETYLGDYDYAFPYDIWVSCEPCAEAGPPTPSVATRTPTPTHAPRDAFEPDDSPEQASVITCDGRPQMHSLDWRFDEDWAAFELSSASAVSVLATGDLVSYYPLIELYDADGQYLVGGNGFLTSTCAQSPAGRYLVHVRANYDPVGSYNLRVLCDPCPATPTPTPTRTPRPTRTPGGAEETGRVFTVDPGVLLVEPSGTGSGLFTTGLSGANASNGPDDGFSPGPLPLILGQPDADGISPLHLQADVALRIGIIDGSHLCLRLLAAASDGSIDCDGGTAYGTAGLQPAGNVGFPFEIRTGIGDPLGPGHGNLLVPAQYQALSPSHPEFGMPCTQVTYTNPIQTLAFTTATATADKGGLILAVAGAPFDCASFETPCSGGQLVAPLPGNQPPVGDVANAIRLAEGPACESGQP